MAVGAMREGGTHRTAPTAHGKPRRRASCAAKGETPQEEVQGERRTPLTAITNTTILVLGLRRH
jgi:hypothetical protein